MADVEERVALGLLFDTYGATLNEHRREVVRLYCEEDLSLAEIASHLAISRQAVFDALQKSRKFMDELEENLHLMQLTIAHRALIAKGYGLLETLSEGDTSKEQWRVLLQQLDELMMN